MKSVNQRQQNQPWQDHKKIRRISQQDRNQIPDEVHAIRLFPRVSPILFCATLLSVSNYTILWDFYKRTLGCTLLSIFKNAGNPKDGISSLLRIFHSDAATFPAWQNSRLGIYPETVRQRGSCSVRTLRRIVPVFH